ncbi:hypothetical protein GIB67_015959, partial [Kingdonia uniflora]
KIPGAFVKHHFNGTLLEKTFLTGPTGKSWAVLMEKVGNGLFLSRGWQKFVSDHSIKVGEFLVFQYCGNSNFKVKIYAKTCCEKNVSLTNENVGGTNSCMAKLNQGESIGPDFSCKHHNRKKRASVSKKKNCGFMEPRRLPIIKAEINGATQVPSSRKSVKLSFATDEKKEANITTCSNKSNNKRVKQFTKIEGKGCFSATVPEQLVVELHLKKKENVMLQGQCGVSWPVKITIRKCGCLDLSQGWSKFWNDNKLAGGDTCKFEFLQGKKIQLAENKRKRTEGQCDIEGLVGRDQSIQTKQNIHENDIIDLENEDSLVNTDDFSSKRKKKDDPNPFMNAENLQYSSHPDKVNGFKLNASKFAELNRVESKAREIEKSCTTKGIFVPQENQRTGHNNPFFTVKMHPSYLKRSSVCIPISFYKRYLTNNLTNVKLYGPDGRMWEAQFSFGRQACICRGWLAFVLEYNMLENDVCYFELIKMTDEVELKVSVSHALVEDVVTLPSHTPPDGQLAKNKRKRAEIQRTGFNNPSFTFKMRRSYLNGSHVHIPHSFYKRYLINKLTKVKLCAPDGRMWEAQIFHRRQPYIGRGWHEFVMKYDMRENDDCLLELIKMTDEVILKVSLSRALVEDVFLKNCLEYLSAPYVSPIPTDGRLAKNIRKRTEIQRVGLNNPSFAVKMHLGYLNGSHAFIPHSFYKRYLINKLMKVNLCAPDGKTWEAQIFHGRQPYIGRGWNEFVLGYRMRENADCLFELIKMTDEVVLKISHGFAEDMATPPRYYSL